MAHIETLPHPPYRQYLNILGQVVIDILHDPVVVNVSGALLQCIFLVDLQLGGDTIAECVHFLICPGCAGPSYSAELVCIGFQDEAIL